MKSVVFIGNRFGNLEVLLKLKRAYSLHMVWVLEDSPLHQIVSNLDITFRLFSTSSESRQEVFNYLLSEKYDLLVSNGCPFILPVNELLKTHPLTLFINTHPSYLPHLKGKTPLNGIFFLGYDFIGATTHYMNDKADMGNIIYQMKMDLTADIDQGLIYFMSFTLEAEVFAKALEILKANNFSFPGFEQKGEGSYFNRSELLFSIDFENDTDTEIIKKVSSVGITSQGIAINNGAYVVFEAAKITNPYLLYKFQYHPIGSILLTYSNKLLVRTKEGIIKFSYVQ